MIERLKQLQSLKFSSYELREALKNDLRLRSEIDALSKHFFGERPRGCSNCYFDYFFKLRGMKETENRNFELKAGALIHDPVNRDISKALTRHNCTDELALYHLYHNPKCIKFFSCVPNNLDELLKNHESDLTVEKEIPGNPVEKKKIAKENKEST